MKTHTLTATKLGNFWSRSTWQITLSETEAVFQQSNKPETHFSIHRSEILGKTALLPTWMGYNLGAFRGRRKERFILAETDLATFQEWRDASSNTPAVPPAQQALHEQSIPFILIGIVMILASSGFAQWWGGLVLAVGVLSFFYPHPYLALVRAAFFFLAALLNLLNGMGPWVVISVFQLYWSYQEVKIFRLMSKVESNSEST